MNVPEPPFKGYPNCDIAHAVRLTLAIAAPLLLLLAVWHLRAVLLLLFAAILLAIILDGLARLVGRILPIGRGWRLGMAAASLLLAGAWVSWMFGHELQVQIAQLVDLLPGGWRDLRDWLGAERVDALADRLSPSGSNILSIIQAIASLATSVLSGLFLALIGGLFLASTPDTYRDGFVMLVSSSWEDRTDTLIRVLARALRAWLRGQLVSMAFVGITIFAGLSAIGAPSPLALAMIAAVLGFIPVVGPLLAAIPAVLVGLTMGMDALLWIVLLYFIVQNFDGNVLNPLVMRRVIRIPPAVTMFSLFAIGVLLGPVGVLLGGPITVLVFTLTRHLWVAGTLQKPLPD